MWKAAARRNTIRRLTSCRIGRLDSWTFAVTAPPPPQVMGVAEAACGERPHEEEPEETFQPLCLAFTPIFSVRSGLRGCDGRPKLVPGRPRRWQESSNVVRNGPPWMRLKPQELPDWLSFGECRQSDSQPCRRQGSPLAAQLVRLGRRRIKWGAHASLVCSAPPILSPWEGCIRSFAEEVPLPGELL
jgi:hypothetical protein